MSESNGFADRNTFLAGTARRRYGEFTLPVSGAKVRFQSMTAEESAAFDGEEYEFKEGLRVWDKRTVELTPARLIVACLVDAEGNRILNENDQDQILKMDAADVEALGYEIRLHCRLLNRLQAKKNSPNASETIPTSN